MNGITSTLKDEIKKSSESKKKEKLKFVLCILSTNIMVAMLFWQNPTAPILENKSAKIIHSSHKLMEIPIEALVPEKIRELPESPVTIISKNKKVIAQKAWLHEEVKKNSEQSYFKIEIADSDIVKVSESMEEGMVAVPFVELKTKTSKRGSRYEISI